MAIRRGGGPAIAVCLLVGLSGIVHVVDGPNFQAYRAVDVVQLVGSGLCLGVALLWLVQRFVKKPAA
jgi:hypothetical protein